jgi:hypothetical protein
MKDALAISAGTILTSMTKDKKPERLYLKKTPTLL